MTKGKTSGFTLIELSIVLVIIGLVVGGIMVGRDLIEAAKVRSQAAQIEQLSSAAKTFKFKYNALPGDFCSSAPAVGLKCGALNSFSDNGTLEDFNGDIILHEQQREPLRFFGHLYDSKLFMPKMLCTNTSSPTEPTTGYYATAINPAAGMSAASFGGTTWIFLGINAVPANCGMNNLGSVSTGGIATPAQAFAIDTKLDDGKPATGTVIETRLNSSLNLTGMINTNANQCVQTVAATDYNISDGTAYCRLLIKLP